MVRLAMQGTNYPCMISVLTRVLVLPQGCFLVEEGGANGKPAIIKCIKASTSVNTW